MKPSISKYSVFIFLHQPTFKDFVARRISLDREDPWNPTTVDQNNGERTYTRDPR